MFETIKDDPTILKFYTEIAKQEQVAGTARHDITHIVNVIARCENILQQLHCEASYIDAGKIAALLHDIGVAYGKKGHAEKSYELARAYFAQKRIDFTEQEEVLQAIKNHSNGFEQDSLIGLTLLLSDKLDITSNRLTPIGKTIQGVRQLQYIETVEVKITEHLVAITFNSTPDIDFAELNTFDFISKVFKAINAFATKINRPANVYFNDKIWQSMTI